MFRGLTERVKSGIASIKPRFEEAKQEAGRLFQETRRPLLQTKAFLGSLLDRPTQERRREKVEELIERPFKELRMGFEKIPEEVREFERKREEEFIARGERPPRGIVPGGISDIGLELGAGLLRDIAFTGEKLVTRKGRKEVLESAIRLPKTYKEEGFLATLSEPALIIGLTIPDFFTGGGKRAGAKKLVSEIADNPSFLRRVVSKADDFLTPIFEHPATLKLFRSARSTFKQVPGGEQMVRSMDEAFDLGQKVMGNATKRFKVIADDLTAEEFEQVLDVRENLIKPANARIARAAKELGVILDDFGRSAKEIGLEVRNPLTNKTVDFAPIGDYIPHRVDLKKLAASKDEVIQHFVNTGQIPDVKKATTFIEGILEEKPFISLAREIMPQASWPKRYGSLEYARLFEWPREVLQRDKRLISDYINRASMRLGQAQIFGPENELVADFFRGVRGKEFGKEAVDLVKRELGIAPTTLVKRANERLASKLRVFQTTTKLGTAAISNAFQSVNTATSYGIGPTTRAIWEDLFGNKQTAEFAMDAGVAVESALRQMAEEFLGPGARKARIQKFITAPGFTQTETFNRRVAAWAGRIFASGEFDKLLKNLDNKAAREAIEKLGINVDDALKAGKLSEDDLIRAGRKAVETTQFTTRVLDMPPAWTTTWGKVLTQFKNFSYKQGQFVADEVVKPALQGNLTPLARYTILGMLLGEVSGDIKSLIRGTKRPEKFLDRMADNIGQIGGAGAPAELIESVKRRGRLGLYEFITGPTVGDFAELLTTMLQAFEGKLEPIEKFMIRQIPVFGPKIKRELFPRKGGVETKKGTPRGPQIPASF